MGTGSYKPAIEVSNDDLSEIVDTNDEWIRTRTGIKSRYLSDVNTSILAAKAGQNALDNSGVKREDIDLLIVATFTPDGFTPSTASKVQKILGIENVTAFDLNAACSGFIYAMNTAAAMIATGQHKKALIIGAEVISKTLDWKDRSLSVIFADGAGAVVLGTSDKYSIGSFYTNSVIDIDDVIVLDGLELDHPFIEKQEIQYPKLYMNGQAVFKFAVKAMGNSIKEVCKLSGHEAYEIDWIVPHQANYRIIQAVAKKLKLDEDKFYLNIDKYGNTSAASIPIALNEMVEKKQIKKGDIVVLVGFGAGLTMGSVLIEWLDTEYPLI
jgi:3-oxoacyl-[acyl-carrier-protein] synthase-3